MTTELATTARRYRWVLLAAAAVALFGAGFLVGSGSVQPALTVHTGMASSTEQTIGVIADEWTYGIPLDVRWEAADGTPRFGGRPDCLPPSDVEVGPITFAAIEVTVGDSTWRQVVWVSCRESADEL